MNPMFGTQRNRFGQSVPMRPIVTARIRAMAADNLMMTEFIVDIKKLGLAVKNLLHILAPGAF
jgi:hypothetical protein